MRGAAREAKGEAEQGGWGICLYPVDRCFSGEMNAGTPSANLPFLSGLRHL